MRLIDADDLKDWSETVTLTFDGGIDINEFDKKLESMPTVEAVPVIRCKECRHLVRYNGALVCSEPNGMMTFSPDGFCSYGQRREEG